MVKEEGKLCINQASRKNYGYPRHIMFLFSQQWQKKFPGRQKVPWILTLTDGSLIRKKNKHYRYENVIKQLMVLWQLSYASIIPCFADLLARYFVWPGIFTIAWNKSSNFSMSGNPWSLKNLFCPLPSCSNHNYRCIGGRIEFHGLKGRTFFRVSQDFTATLRYLSLFCFKKCLEH